MNNILAAKINLDCDYSTITQEVLDCSKFWRYIPPYKHQIDNPLNKEFNVATEDDFAAIDYIDVQANRAVIKRGGGGAHIFYMRENTATTSQSFADTKPLPHNTWKWRDELNIPYTKKFIESLPFTTIGMIRVFIFKDTFLPVHKDYSTGGKIHSPDYEKCLGLSIIPTTGNVPMKIWSNQLNKVVSVPVNLILFNDSVWHAVPKTTGYRITIRVFGDIDYSYFSDKIDTEHAYYL
jgi:hypothetical protein